MFAFLKSAQSKVLHCLGLVAVAAACLFVDAQTALAQVTPPTMTDIIDDTGIKDEMANYGTAMGSVIRIVVIIALAVAVVLLGMRWIRSKAK